MPSASDVGDGINWKEKIGARVVYTPRNGDTKYGTVRDAVHISKQSGWQVDVNIDGAMRSRYYVPEDMLKLIPDDLADTLSGDS